MVLFDFCRFLFIAHTAFLNEFVVGKKEIFRGWIKPVLSFRDKKVVFLFWMTALKLPMESRSNAARVQTK
jgi:hypothetical protein